MWWILAACGSTPGTEAPPWGGFSVDPVQVPLPAPASPTTAWFSTPTATVEATCPDGLPGELRYGLVSSGYGVGATLVVYRSTCTDATIGVAEWALTDWVRDAPAQTRTWTLPAAAAPGWPAAAGTVDETCPDGSSGSRRWEVADLDGDGATDLVRTLDGCLDPAVGVSRWAVHRGGPGGFAAESLAWTLPGVDVELPHPWAELDGEDTWGCPDGGYGTLTHTVRDLSGDGLPDLVVTRDDCADATLGEDHWNVYPGGADGFAAEPLRWPLPPRAGGRPWWTVDGYAGASCNPEVEAAQRELRDLDGDGFVDLLLTGDVCADDWDPEVWRLYRGDGAGFASEPLPWSLPLSSTGTGWPRTGADETAVACPDGRVGSRHWVLDDLDGDGRDELVLTYDGCGAQSVDTWYTYRAGEDGFADEPSVWALPGGSVGEVAKWGFHTTSGGATACLVGGWGSLDYATVDVDGDGVRDLLVTRDGCADPGAGFDHWRVFHGAVAG